MVIKNRNISVAEALIHLWTGFLDPAAIFYLRGSTSNVKINNMRLFVDDSITADKFMPIAFALNPGETDNQTLDGPAPLSKPYIEVPHDINFEDISLDAYYFGWHGSGGLGDWFPPPHLFYFNTK